MKNLKENPACARAEDMLALLYEEAQGAEKNELTRHLDSCALCRQEFTAFQSVRADLGVWRSEIIRTAPARVVHLTGLPETREPSLRAAWDALREFFTLSPVWLRGATAFATLAIMAALGWAVNTVTKTQPTETPVKIAVAQTPPTVPAVPAGVSEAEVKSRIEAAVQAERASLQTQQEQQIQDLTEQSADARQRLAALQTQLVQARRSSETTPRYASVKASGNTAAPRSRRTNAPALAQNTSNRTPVTVAADEDEVSLAEVLLGGGR